MSKVTKEIINSRISGVVYHVIPDTTITMCVITMANGYDVIGYSACVDSTNFDAALGQKYSYEDAYEKIWPLEGYLLQERMSEASVDSTMDIGSAVRNLLSGERVCRAGWNGKGMYLVWVDSTSWGVSPQVQSKCIDAESGCYGFVMMKTADGKIVPWLCSQADLMATDWTLYQPQKEEQ